MTKAGEKNCLHAVVVPFPVQGTINPLMNLAKLLSLRGFFITFVNTEWSLKCMTRADRDKEDEAALGSSFRFVTIPDGLPADHGRLTNLTEYATALEKAGPALEHHLLCSLSEGVPPITCIISENFMSCTHEVAINLGVPRVIFWTMCAASSIAQCKAKDLLSRGHIPVKVEEGKRAEKMISCLPGNLPPLWPSDLLSLYRAADTSDGLYKWALHESEIENKGDYVLVNTFDELEDPQAVAALSINACPALGIGPVFLTNFLEGIDLNSRVSMLEEDEGCIEWLDKQKPASVIYVSFGSIAVKTNEQLEELALGLESSQYPFLWVLRMDTAGGKPAVLPEGFMERTKDRGLLVKWAPQLKVLSHPSVAGFMTHSGWNSCLESISMGIPMLGWPYFMDQFLNCRFAKDIWKIGMDFEDVDVDNNKVVTREEVENGVRSIMQSEELRGRALKLKEAAVKAVGQGGSSFFNLNRFIDDITEISKSGPLNGVKRKFRANLSCEDAQSSIE